MKQIIINWLYVFIGPPAIGLALRFFCRRWKRAYWITLCLLLLTAAAWTLAWTAPQGLEWYGLAAVQASLAAVGSLAAGAALWLAGRYWSKMVLY